MRWARYCVYVRNYVQLPRLTPPTERFNGSTRLQRLDQWFPMQKCRFSTPLTRVTRLVWPYRNPQPPPNQNPNPDPHPKPPYLSTHGKRTLVFFLICYSICLVIFILWFTTPLCILFSPIPTLLILVYSLLQFIIFIIWCPMAMFNLTKLYFVLHCISPLFSSFFTS